MPQARDRRDGGKAPALYGVYPSVVTDNRDPDGLGRVKVSLPRSAEGEDRGVLWARMATLMAGDRRGSWFLPEVGDEVLVAFEAGDLRRPCVVGALWNDAARPPQSADEGEHVRLIRTRSGHRLVFDDTAGAETVTLETATGQQVVLRGAGNSVEIRDGGGNRIALDSSGVTVEAAARVTVRAARVEVEAPLVELDSAVVNCGGTLQAKTVVTDTVVAKTYTPGAGNVL